MDVDAPSTLVSPLNRRSPQLPSEPAMSSSTRGKTQPETLKRPAGITPQLTPKTLSTMWAADFLLDLSWRSMIHIQTSAACEAEKIHQTKSCNKTQRQNAQLTHSQQYHTHPRTRPDKHTRGSQILGLIRPASILSGSPSIQVSSLTHTPVGLSPYKQTNSQPTFPSGVPRTAPQGPPLRFILSLLLYAALYQSYYHANSAYVLPFHHPFFWLGRWTHPEPLILIYQHAVTPFRAPSPPGI